MKQFLLTLLGALTAVVVALVVYDRLVVAPRQAAQLEAAQQAHQISLASADAQAQQIAASLDASVDRSVADAQQAMDDLADEQDRRRLAADALARASMMRAALAEYYMSEGRWPPNAAAAGIGAPDSFAGGAVAGIDVDNSGGIAIRLNAKLSADARIRLTPRVSPDNGMIQWRCVVQGSPEVSRYLPACRD